MTKLGAIGTLVAGLCVSLLGCYIVDGIGLMKFMAGYFMMLFGLGGSIVCVSFWRKR
jgi:hypothetical protein